MRYAFGFLRILWASVAFLKTKAAFGLGCTPRQPDNRDYEAG